MTASPRYTQVAPSTPVAPAGGWGCRKPYNNRPAATANTMKRTEWLNADMRRSTPSPRNWISAVAAAITCSSLFFTVTETNAAPRGDAAAVEWSHAEHVAHGRRSAGEGESRENPLEERRTSHSHPPGGPSYTNAQMMLAFVKDVYPWLYDAGTETIQILRSRKGAQEKDHAMRYFDHLLRLTLEHPVFRDFDDDDGEGHSLLRNPAEMIRETYEHTR